MELAELKRIVQEQAPRLQTVLGLQRWEINFFYGLIHGTSVGEVAGRCKLYPLYNRASIEVDPNLLDSESEAIRVIRHEFLHIVLASFTLPQKVTRPFVQDGPSSQAVEEVWTDATEQGVLALERMFDGLCEANVSRAEQETKAMASGKKTAPVSKKAATAPAKTNTAKAVAKTATVPAKAKGKAEPATKAKKK